MSQMNISDYVHTSAVENVTKAIARANGSAGHNVMIQLCEDRALQRAKAVDNGEIGGRLKGVPFIAKDNFLTYDSPTTAASDMLRPFVAPIQARAIEKLEAEGAICIGKANLDAFAHGGSTENSAFGPTLNAHDVTKVAGGSSGGSAVAVALDIVPFSLGTDTGGSIRQPASFNGVVGVKPTYGMISRYGVVAMASSTDVIGCFSRTVADAELVLDVLAGRDASDMTTYNDYFVPSDNTSPLKIGLIQDFMNEGTDSSVRDVVDAYVESLKAAGHTVDSVSLPMAKYSLAMYYIIVPAEIMSNLARYDGIRYGRSGSDKSSLENLIGSSRDEGFMLENKRRIMIGSYVLSSGFFDAYYLKAQKARTLLIAEFDALFEKYDVLIGPVAPSPAFGLGEKTDDPLKMYLSDIMTVGVSLAGLPAMSVPVGADPAGLPIGVQLIAQRKRDAEMLSLARAMEVGQ